MNTSVATPARRSDVLRGDGLTFIDGHPSEPGHGVRVAEFLGAPQGAIHLTVCLVELAPGAEVQGHVHPFEESFFVLEGEALINLGGSCFRLVSGDFGVVPIATGHAWANRSDSPTRIMRVYSPQPRPIAGRGGWGVFKAPDAEVPRDGEPVEELHPRHAHVGHFAEEDMPPPGPILMPGYHGANIRNVSIRMLVDELLGARHHTLFIVQFVPVSAPTLSAKEHFHPFEEMYYFLSGEATGSFDGERVPIAPGDLIFAGVGASHGFSAAGMAPVRWIEAQSPLPPASSGFFFHDDWAKLEALA